MWCRSWPLEPEDTFRSWWRDSSVNERKRAYVGRHRYDQMVTEYGWRVRWAEYETQWWPTLDVSGDAFDLIPIRAFTRDEWGAVVRFLRYSACA